MSFNVGIDRKDVYVGKARTTTKKATTKKVGGSGGSGIDMRAIERRADEGEAPLVQKEVSKKVSLEIQKARQQKGMTQKELALKISERPQVVADYEAGRAVPSQQILIKFEKALGVKLRGLK